MAGQEFQQRRTTDVLDELCNTKHVAIEGRLVRVEDAILKLQNRLPVWASLSMTAMGTAIGGLIGKVL